MPGDGDPETGGFNPTTLGDFLTDNYQLFAVMGIFGALAIYLNRIRESLNSINSDLIDLGILVSLSLFIFISLSVYIQFIREATTEERMLPGGASPGLVVFFVPFTLLIGIITYISTRFEAALFLLSEIIAFVMGWYLYALAFQFVAVVEFDLVDGVAEKLEGRDESGHRLYAIIGLIVSSYHFGQSAVSILLSVFLALIPVGTIGYIICCYGFSDIISRFYLRVFSGVHGSVNSIVAAFLIGVGIASVIGLLIAATGVVMETRRTVKQLRDREII